MAKHNLLRTVLVLLAGLLLWGAASLPAVGFAQSQKPYSGQGQTPCADTTDAQIVTAVQQKIKADPRFNDQWRHINVSSRNRVVTLSGWAKGRAQVAALVRFAAKTACVKRVINRLLPFRKVGCGPGEKPCGDICIDRNQDCNPIL
ncbi:MAG TPA: BON domain-containing protein [Blastocatellia bacterium]|nr:BON domain-containing protein [Blastocatellia bacterium]